MVEITGSIQHELWAKKALPPVEQVRPLVWSVPIECLPFPIRYTLCYLVANDEGKFIVIDPGWDSEVGRAQLLEGIRLAGLDIAGLEGIVVTHFHPDHIGMVSELAETTGAWIGMHPAEGDYLDRTPSVDAALSDDSVWMERCGVPTELRDGLAMTAEKIAHFTSQVSPSVPLEHLAAIPLAGRVLRSVWTPGHTGGHICIVDIDSEVIFTGDHVLPRISPNVGIGFYDGGRDPISEYYLSLEKMDEWDEFEVLPAHEWRFRGLAERSAQLGEHTTARSNEVREITSASPDATPWEVAKQLTWSRGWESLDGDNLRAALSETVAHLHHNAMR